MSINNDTDAPYDLTSIHQWTRGLRTVLESEHYFERSEVKEEQEFRVSFILSPHCSHIEDAACIDRVLGMNVRLIDC